MNVESFIVLFSIYFWKYFEGLFISSFKTDGMSWSSNYLDMFWLDLKTIFERYLIAFHTFLQNQHFNAKNLIETFLNEFQVTLQYKVRDFAGFSEVLYILNEWILSKTSINFNVMRRHRYLTRGPCINTHSF